MRFFAHDGKTTHGPAGIEELLKIPGFDGDTLVCPVGSDDSADWKPALAYPPFKKALLSAPPPEPAEPPRPALPPMPSLQPATNPLPVPSPFSALAPLAPPPPAPASAAPPASVAPPAPVEPPKAQKLCPRCLHANLEDARFCNACGSRMDGRLEDISVPPPPAIASVPAPAPILPPEPILRPEPVLPPEPATAAAPPANAFEHLDPMLTYPVEPVPAPAPEPVLPGPQPGRMGRLAGLEENEPAAPTALEPAAAPSPAPEPAADAAPVPVWKRPAAVFAMAALAVMAVGGSYLMLGRKSPPPAEPVAELAPPAPSPAPAPEPAPAPTIYSAPPQTSSPAMPPPPRSPKKKAAMRAETAGTAGAPKPRRARKPRRAAAPQPEPRIVGETGGGDTIIESRAPEPEPEPKPRAKGKRAAKAAKSAKGAAASPGGKDPLLEALITDATRPGTEAASEPAAEPAAPAIGQRPDAKPGRFSLPGLERKVSASDRAGAPQAKAPRPADGETAPPERAAPAEPAKSSPTPGIEDEPAKSAEGDQLALVQVHEQFDFCAQLLAQAAYGDHYDTCLCKDAREAAPYRGRRGYYVSAKKKEAGAGRLETSAKIVSSQIDLGVARVKALWKSGSDEKGRESVQTWKLEDGLWCQAP